MKTSNQNLKHRGFRNWTLGFALLAVAGAGCVETKPGSAADAAASTASDASSGTSLWREFGDAPDGLDARYGNGVTAGFPSRLASDGARHEDPTQVALGLPDEDGLWPATEENDATDPMDPDGVQNIDEEPGESDHDAKDDGLLTYVFGDDEYERLEFSVTAADDASAGTYYLNVLFDWNRDGRWEGMDANGAEEWAVKNFEVAMSPGDAFTDETEPFLTGAGVHPVWVRLTLSDTPVDPAAYPEGWDGTGAFALGETEDYILVNSQVLSLEDDGVGLDGVPHNPFNPPVGGGGGGNGGGGDDPCEYTNYVGMTLCEGRSTTRLLTIGGFAPDSLSAFSSDPGVASVSLNEANVTVTGNAEGTATIYLTATQLGCTYYVIVSVEVKDCPPARHAMIECCTPEEIRRDPALCKNCHVVGRQFNQSNTYGGGGTIPETSMEGRKTSISKSIVLVRGGGLVDVITLYYECDPCPEEASVAADDDDDDFFALLEHVLFGGENQLIDTWEEYDDLRSFYDEEFDEASYECATRYFEELYETMEQGGEYFGE